jgi:competence protein ComGC
MESDVAASKSVFSRLLPFLILAVIIGLLALIAIPNFAHGGSTKLLGIIHQLQQIDAAKQQWALEHELTNTASLNRVVTEKDLAPYLLPAFTQKEEFGNPAFGELYLIRDLNQSPEAVLTRTLTERYTDSSLPKGTVIRLDRGVGGEWCYECYEIILPDGSSKIYRWMNGSLAITNR